MIYKAVEVIWILAREDGGTGIEGTIRGPRGPQNNNLRDSKTLQKQGRA